MKKIFCVFCFLFSVFFHGVFAYQPTPELTKKAETVQKKLETLFKTKSDSQKKMLLDKYDTYFTDLQNAALMSLGENANERMYVYEYLRRHLPGVDSFTKSELIYDELNSTIWTHAPKGFDILYSPLDTPTFGSVDPLNEYRAQVNGGYFSRTDVGRFHAGLLYLGGIFEGQMVFTDRQITHLVCINANYQIRMIPNILFADNLTTDCVTLFQTGPMVYQRDQEKEAYDFAADAYIGRPHTRTVMVLFQKNNSAISQDLWFLTVNEDVTLEEVKNIVLRETKFIDNYDDIWVLNLDGGSSVAYLNHEHPELTIGRAKKLPIVLGIK